MNFNIKKKIKIIIRKFYLQISYYQDSQAREENDRLADNLSTRAVISIRYLMEETKHVMVEN